MMSNIHKRRAGAYFCDQVIIWLGHSILYSIFFQTFMPTLQHFPMRAQNLIYETMTDSSSFTLIICFLTYYMITPWLGDGQTIGQRLFGISVAINHKNKSSPTLEMLSYIMRGTGLLINQMAYGLPFLVHLLRKDGRGLQDLCSFSTVEFSEAKSQFTVIYAEHAATSPREEDLSPLSQYPSELQLNLPLDLKNPSIMQLHTCEIIKLERKKAA